MVNDPNIPVCLTPLELAAVVKCLGDRLSNDPPPEVRKLVTRTRGKFMKLRQRSRSVERPVVVMDVVTQEGP